MATRVNAVFEQRLPVSTAIAYAAGALVDGAQSAVNTVTVHSGHSVATGDKFLYALTERNISIFRVFVVDGTPGATSVAFTGATFSFPDNALLISLGADTGGTENTDGSFNLPNYDGSTIQMFSDSNGDDALTSVAVQPTGEAGHYASTVPVWVLGLDSGNRPIQVLLDVGASGSSSGGNITRGTGFPGGATLGDQHLLTVGGIDILYTYMQTTSGPGWVEGISAP